MITHSALRGFVAVCWLLAAGGAAADDAVFKLTIRNHRFEPAELVVPAAQKVKLEIDNQDATAEEFESYELNREKLVPAKATVVIFVGPLKPGRYPFFGDFNKESAKGVLIAK
jgi:plastocyanin